MLQKMYFIFWKGLHILILIPLSTIEFFCGNLKLYMQDTMVIHGHLPPDDFPAFWKKIDVNVSIQNVLLLCQWDSNTNISAMFRMQTRYKRR